MILTDREIEAAIQTGRIIVTPAPNADMFSSSSLDLTLGASAVVWKRVVGGVRQTICPADPDFNYREVAREHTEAVALDRADGFTLKPSSFLLAYTAEKVELPTSAGLAARVEGKSSLARLGVGVHITAPTIHSGFIGQIQLEICNYGPLDVELRAGMPVCQLIFEQTYGTPQKGYKGQFQGQVE